MKIAYVANVRMPTEKAHGLQIMEMCRAFARAGHEVTLIVPGRKNPIAQSVWEYYGFEKNFGLSVIPVFDFVHWIRWPAELSYWLMAVWFGLKARAAVRELSPDVVYSRDALALYFSSAGAPKRIFESHFLPKRGYWLHRRLWKRCDRIVALTEGLKKDLVAKGAPAERLIVAHDGVDLGDFATGKTKGELRKALGLPEEKFIAVYSGHLYPPKGAFDLIEAARKLDENHLVILVGGREKELAEARSRASELGLGNVVFAGQVPHRNVPEYLLAADVLVLPTRAGDRFLNERYTSPMKLFEYLAAGRAIVATDLPGIREILGDSDALIVPPGDPAALAVAIVKLRADPSKRETLAAAARRLAPHYTWSARAESILAI